MKMVKSLMLGSAAGLFAMSGAQAADLPVKAAPVEYEDMLPMVPVLHIPGATPALPGAICASTPRSTAASTISRRGSDPGQHNWYADYYAA
jgi:hypothetical protein